jgi:hypothetical protein
MKIKIGLKIKFYNEKQRYTVMASSENFCILTKPFNAKKTVLYTVIDWNRQVTGTEDLIFGMGAETKKQCKEMLERLTKNETKVSMRNFRKLDIEEITT